MIVDIEEGGRVEVKKCNVNSGLVGAVVMETRCGNELLWSSSIKDGCGSEMGVNPFMDDKFN